MKAMILAAGRGERMRPLTDNCPKPMLKVADIPLIEHHIVKLKENGVVDIVINLAWCGEKIVQYFASGKKWGVTIQYSDEKFGALETAGGIKKALPLLIEEETDDIFIVINGDVYTDYDFKKLLKAKESMSHDQHYAHLILVNNPEHNPNGDFQLHQGKVFPLDKDSISEALEQKSSGNTHSHTYSGIGLYSGRFFDVLPTEPQKTALGPMLRAFADKGLVCGSYTDAMWTDVGTPERLEQLNHTLKGL